MAKKSVETTEEVSEITPIVEEILPAPIEEEKTYVVTWQEKSPNDYVNKIETVKAKSITEAKSKIKAKGVPLNGFEVKVKY